MPVNSPRIATGGLVLAEVDGGFSVISADTAEPPALARACHPKVPAPQPAPVASPRHHMVRPGDTLTHIAAAYGIPWESLWAANTDRVKHPDRLFSGQLLRLP